MRHMEQGTVKARIATGVVRVSFALVFAVNVHCALSFVLDPQTFASSYELSGVPGIVAIQGMGVAFLMWNATYPAVIVSPKRFRALAVVVLAQQVIGLAGESWILLSIPADHPLLTSSIERFIAFDALGLVLTTAALGLFSHVRKTNAGKTGARDA